MPNTILLKGTPFREQAELASGQTITPGHLIDLDTSGDVIVHANAGQNHPGFVAVENDLAGDDIDDNYDTAAEKVQYDVAQRGKEYYMILKDGENVDIGDPLESAGDGTLQEHTPQAVDEGGTGTYTIYNNAIVGIALEAKAPSGSTARIKVKIV